MGNVFEQPFFIHEYEPECGGWLPSTNPSQRRQWCRTGTWKGGLPPIERRDYPSPCYYEVESSTWSHVNFAGAREKFQKECARSQDILFVFFLKPIRPVKLRIHSLGKEGGGRLAKRRQPPTAGAAGPQCCQVAPS